jgi:hypothetical protein
MNDDDLKTLLQEMQWVRKLLMLQTLAAGYKQKHLAAALGGEQRHDEPDDAQGFCQGNSGRTCRRWCNGGMSDERTS